MTLVLSSGPAVEPVTLADAKAQLRVDGTADDTLIASLILTSRLHVEAGLGVALNTQSWSYFLDAWPPGAQVVLPLRPVQSVAAVRLYADDESVQTVPAETYLLDLDQQRPRLVRRGATVWPVPSRSANGIEIAMVAGYGDNAADVPAPIRQAILLLTAHWYDHRSPFEVGTVAAPVPPMVSELLAPYRAVRL
ncbi:MAG TPA: head-tail connector protein [Hyphomicrobiaceae bacterium]|nr:head-tail connector protein [Hyphomicrobiaceae bacterium]